jgi:hypothetical protein
MTEQFFSWGKDWDGLDTLQFVVCFIVREIVLWLVERMSHG